MDRAKKRRCEKKLKKIYARVPDCECKGLCVKACGPVLFSQTEMDKVKDLAPHGWEAWDAGTYMPTRAPESDLTCPFLKDARCSIYDSRPLICRVYGTTEKLACEHGCKQKMSVAQEARIRDDYFALIRDENAKA